MNARRLTAATLAAAALLVPAVPASATCWVGPVYTCGPMPTDPVTDPLWGPVFFVYNTATLTVLCAAGYTQYCV